MDKPQLTHDQHVNMVVDQILKQSILMADDVIEGLVDKNDPNDRDEIGIDVKHALTKMRHRLDEFVD